MLKAPQYLEAVSLTQIVSIDLIIKKDDKYLVGKRRNEPARGFYFVPGGRVYKQESLKDGLTRLIREEIGETKFEWEFRSIGDHCYKNNFLNAKDVNGNLVPQHYVCIAVDVLIQKLDEKIFRIQHDDSLWLTKKEILEHCDVHPFTKYYFVKDAPNKFV
tara:strand:- start:238 stop:717 length:480 start_codon:yes stop_codon:yes gene_type:complete